MNYQLTDAELKCLRSLKQAADGLDIPLFLVGATARWLVFNLPNDIPLHRTTADWDFGVRVADWNIFNQLRTKLMEQADPFEQGRHYHELIHCATGIKIDLVPFGKLENDCWIHWPNSKFAMNVFGFSEAFENAIQLDLAPDLKLSVATVPLLVALKFFAFADRKDEMDRDLSDLWHVIQNYVLQGRESELYDDPFSQIIDEQFDWEYARPLLLGYDVGRACQAATVQRLLPILQELTDPYSKYIHQVISPSASAKREESERKRVSGSFYWLRNGLQLHR